MRLRHLTLSMATAAGVALMAWSALAQQTPNWGVVGAIFADNCVRCHNAQHVSGLNLSSYSRAIAGGRSGPAMIAGDPDSSLLMQRIRGEIAPRMPRNAARLSDETIAAIAAWIAAGMPE